MKGYITGASKGLGKELKTALTKKLLFENEGGGVVSLDRDKGFDLNENLDDFVKNDFNVYINNAQSSFQQTELLYKLFEENRDRECLIVNIGSVSGDGDRKEINKYAVEKASLEKATTQLQLVPDSQCKVSLVKLGRMDTDMVKHIDAPKMFPKRVAERIVDDVIGCFIFEKFYVKSITYDIGS